MGERKRGRSVMLGIRILVASILLVGLVSCAYEDEWVDQGDYSAPAQASYVQSGQRRGGFYPSAEGVGHGQMGNQAFVQDTTKHLTKDPRMLSQYHHTAQATYNDLRDGAKERFRAIAPALVQEAREAQASANAAFRKLKTHASMRLNQVSSTTPKNVNLIQGRAAWTGRHAAFRGRGRGRVNRRFSRPRRQQAMRGRGRRAARNTRFTQSRYQGRPGRGQYRGAARQGRRPGLPRPPPRRGRQGARNFIQGAANQVPSTKPLDMIQSGYDGGGHGGGGHASGGYSGGGGGRGKPQLEAEFQKRANEVEAQAARNFQTRSAELQKLADQQWKKKVSGIINQAREEYKIKKVIADLKARNSFLRHEGEWERRSHAKFEQQMARNGEALIQTSSPSKLTSQQLIQKNSKKQVQELAEENDEEDDKSEDEEDEDDSADEKNAADEDEDEDESLETEKTEAALISQAEDEEAVNEARQKELEAEEETEDATDTSDRD